MQSKNAKSPPNRVEHARVVPIPEFTSDRMKMLSPIVTPRALELALGRILRPKERLVEADGDTGKEEPETVKVALLLLSILNPDESLTNGEEGHRRGLSAKIVGKRTAAGEI